MMSDYRIILTARNEGVEYRDPGGVFRFNVLRNGDTWSLYLPGSKGDNYQRRTLSPEEQARILPRVTEFLEKTKWLCIAGGPYMVKLVQDANAN